VVFTDNEQVIEGTCNPNRLVQNTARWQLSANIQARNHMAIDLSGLNIVELEKLIVDARARIEVVKKQQFAEIRRTLESQARNAGFDIYELFGGRAARAAGGERKAVPPKYRNPDNADQTWTGRGKQPVWLRDLLAAGKKLESMAI